MPILSYVFSLLGLACMIASSLVKGKRMKYILFLAFAGNFLIATSYILNRSGLNGAASCYLGCIIAVVNYFFDYKEKIIPKWLMGIYIAAFVLLNLLVNKFEPAVLIAMAGSIVFVLGIGQKSGSKYRFWIIVNVCIWILYDIVTKSYSVLISHAVQLIFTLAGALINDIKRK